MSIPHTDPCPRRDGRLKRLSQVPTESSENLIPVRKFIRECRRSRSRVKTADSSGVALTGGRLLASGIALKRVLDREVLSPDERNVGVLLPPSVGGCVANVALALGRRVAVNLNYTMTDSVNDFCVREAGIRHVLTSRKFLDKKPATLHSAKFVFLEDLKARVHKSDKACGALAAYVLPPATLERWLGLDKVDPNELLTIIFTSGSTGEPKGVMLSHRNIATNIDAAEYVLNLRPDDVLLGILPFFHSFGYTASMWLTLCHRVKAVYHYNPLDSRMIGKLSQEHRVTVLMATPTFLRNYLRRVDAEQFASVNAAVVGAEKLPLDVAEQFQSRFDVLPSEGYGTTELSPIVSINIPADRTREPGRTVAKLGTIGRTLPGVSAKIVHPETRENLGCDLDGLLLIKGPNVMLGYLNHPEKTAEMIRDGWYNTGDIARIDSEGFITITGRESRFSKIAGEMVPHIRIEEEIARIIDAARRACAASDEPDLQVAVTSVSDPGKGERIIVLHRELPISADEIRRQLSAAGLPNLWIPGKDSFFQVERIPVLGTGKMDLQGIKQIARTLTGG